MDTVILSWLVEAGGVVGSAVVIMFVGALIDKFLQH